MIAQDYLDLITSKHQGQPNFTALLSNLVALPVQVQALLASLGSLFDLDTPPVGDQLDVIGQWVGFSRNVNIPIVNTLFTWNSTAEQGWGGGSWQDPNNPSNVNILPDDSYLALLRAKIAANQWDGTTEGAYLIWQIVIPNLTLLIQDNQNMTMLIALAGGTVDSLTQAILNGGYFSLRPEGVKITEYVYPVDATPLFGWGVSNAYIGGWGSGSWGIEAYV